MKDRQIQKMIQRESRRQTGVINLIASENDTSADVREALGSVFVNKYAEGYPHARYYGGNEHVDELEELTKARALKLFGLSAKTWGVNVQPYSGSPANLAVYFALIPLGAKIMGLELTMGGHLSHGHKVSMTGKLWQQVAYGVDTKTEALDYDEIGRIARREKPAMIVAGFTAYSRVIDFKKFRKIANSVGALLFIDMSHFAGLVAGKAYPSPFSARGGQGLADVVMTTTHKTLRGPRSALLFSKKEFSEKIDKAVFPGLQGGPHANQIAAVAVALQEASFPAFKKYAKQIIKNAKVLSDELARRGWRVVSGGTDTHLILIDTQVQDISGARASDALEEAGIVVNKNTIPYDARSPRDPSGIRLGTADVTTRGMREPQMRLIAEYIDEILRGVHGDAIKKNIARLARQFPQQK